MKRLFPKPTALCLALSMASLPLFAMAAGPSGKIDCIAPANPGGGWDFTCRSVGQALSETGIIDGSVQTTNMPGASGGVAYSHVVTKRAGQNNVIVSASTATTTRLAQRQFPGMNADMVNWVGTVGADYGVIAVRKDSPYQSLDELLDAMEERPGSVSFAGGSASGGWDHLKVLMMARADGIQPLNKVKYLPFDGGGEAMTQVVGGHIDAFSGDASETLGFVASGDLRVLAVLADEHLPGALSDVPTAKEQGVDVEGINWRGFYIPAEVAEADVAWWENALQDLYDSEEWKKVMAQNGLIPFDRRGEAFDDYVHQQIQDIEEISQEVGLIQ
ncbi:Bug family tripartite tricarboxylate transporter substrate binding protein [Salinicola halophilus]|uniref:Bug family tripartite tricarboxylate transporter substrate binding protein n=1 Tax=Salinicola halophilus TaxID=184065 RepID=UPI000DA25CEC|nr:tripartite tricarboxylate transporter substrate binding protein [Salinicola halophilus]